MKYAFIVNPLAGRGRARKTWQQVEPLLCRERTGAVYYTTRAGEAVDLARQAQDQGASVLVAVGGDGTVLEVVNGMDLDRTVLGLLPAGTGNDLSRSLGYPACPRAVAAGLFRWGARAMDLGKTNYGYFTNVIGAGFDAQVAHEINANIKFLTGTAAYLAGILKILAIYRNAPMTLCCDGRSWEGKALLVAVGNGAYYAGGINIVPPARVDDGWFHLCLAKDVGKLDTLLMLPRLFKGGHTRHPKVEILQARRVTVDSPVPLMVQADGEILGPLPLTVELLPGALRVLAPAASGELLSP